MRALRLILLATLLLLPSLPARSAQAYSPANTHRWLARQAVELLVATYPGEYDELLEHMDLVVEGAFHEDDFFFDGNHDPKTLRVMRHFFHAPDAHGLTYGDGEFPNSFQWHGLPNDGNEWDYHDGLLAYRRGDYDMAYFIVGHTAHLIADLTVPAHSHLDDHGPPNGDDYEQYCARQSHSPTDVDLPTVPVGTPIPQFATLSEIFQATANASYYRNLFPGQLPEQGDASGIIQQMFPDISQGFLSGEWSIPGIGKLGAAFFEDQPGYYYFKKNDVPTLYDVVDYDPHNPGAREFGPTVGDAPLVERMSQDLIPVAILHSAAAIKFFVDEARSLPSIEDPADLPPTGQDHAVAGCQTAGGNTSLLATLALLFLLAAFRRHSQRGL